MMERMGKAVEGHRSPRRWRVHGMLGWRRASWNAPAVWCFDGQNGDSGQREGKSENWEMQSCGGGYGGLARESCERPYCAKSHRQMDVVWFTTTARTE